ncbi:putative ATP-dependent RNA helicase MSS116 mitochondrial precursor [Triangularia verruculosa]|uniref:ATP-dependent RNA helicase n=1 Tax=Triangularia verruculosa TaxID=2587418 RepID=A0AAN6XKJ8_9PEZI|nr:putative ATP-dependent RNA helicase MSS116 mitochondrial precursor [Triangularia verruculosa]
MFLSSARVLQRPLSRLYSLALRQTAQQNIARSFTRQIGPTRVSISTFSPLHSNTATVEMAAAPPPTTTGASERTSFSQLKGRIEPQLLKNIANMGLTHMSPVQEQVLQMSSLKNDCLVQAKTGTGKTVAFLLPALQNILTAPDLQREFVALLVLAPTRELAQQIADECDKLTAKSLDCHIAVGGTAKESRLRKFLNGKPTILVATPGRLIDYLSEEETRHKLSKLRCVVLDEADRMLDQGFAPSIKKILQQIPKKQTAGWQGMCFSATVPNEIQQFLPLVLDKNHTRICTIDPNETPTVDRIPQSAIPVESVSDALPVLHSYLMTQKKLNPDLKAVIFCGTARHAGLLYQVFGPTGGAAPKGLPCYQIHSRLSQPARTRAIEEFKVAESGLMFASDVIGRGMDFPDIDLVIQMGFPPEKAQYVHRVGRTGRAGKSGEATMILTPDEMRFVRANKDFPIKVTEQYNHPDLPRSVVKIQESLQKVPEQTKFQAYTAFLGFNVTIARQLGLQYAEVVQLANEFAYSMGCEEVPEVEQRTVSKMGLRGIPGLRIEGKPGVTRAASGPNNRTGGGRAQGGPGRMQRGKVADPRAPNGSGPSAGAFNGAGNRPPGGGNSRDGGNRRGPRESTGANAEEPSRKRPRRGAQV